jgi:peptidoglycan/xylan/chitin deacetylase (PgdA/CDA1 family)
MRFNPYLKSTVLSLDEMLARLCLTVTREQGSLLTFLFHGLFQNSDEVRSGLMDPQQGITVGMLRKFILHFREQSYRFVAPKDILKGLELGEKNLLITFDDGYYNNIRALPVLEEFRVPAVFFISSDHVKYGKAFWWDVVFREFRKRNRTDEEIRDASASYKQLTTAAVESDLRQQFGESALKPIGDLDRPFSFSELEDFARHPLVFLGNHTKDHAILTNYSAAEISEQIQMGQNDIREMTGQIPDMIAYPNGSVSPAIRAAAWDAGLRLGVGAWPGKNRLPLRIDTGGAMAMKRFTLWGDNGIDPQCRISRSSLSLYRSLKELKMKINPGLSPMMRST